MSWGGLLAAALEGDPGRPLVTFYDDASGERVELSVATYANWVAKTANLLVDGLGAAPGDVVALVGLPRHWQVAVWAGATWTAGLTLAVGATQDEPAVAVVGPDAVTGRGGGVGSDAGSGAAPPLAAGAHEVIGLSLRPLGGPFPEPLPAGALDYAREVAGYGDRYAGPPVGNDAPALLDPDAGTLSYHEVVARARVLAELWGLQPGGRLLVAEPLGAIDDVLAGSVLPLALAASVVLVAHADPDRQDARGEQERVTAIARAGG